ncbi:MAG: hypothetical protein K1Y36_26345 [Blastocatellia bacterium]|nr:hypothetical protein [Blastocatellia bacterium]
MKPLFRLFSLIVICMCGLLVNQVLAGGPLMTTSDGKPVLWAKGPVSGGALNSQTVDAQNRVVYHVDSGPLGTLTNEDGTALVDRIFKAYTDIPTSSIVFVNGGRILDPDTKQPVDVTGSNVGKFLGNRPTFQNPIVFDSDGSITGGGGVLGFFTFLQFRSSDNALVEGAVALNGRAVDSVGGKASFLGVFTHEFGHFAGPLDHGQINGNIAVRSTSAVLPTGFSSGQIFDLYAPFTETLYPFLFSAPGDSQIAARFRSSGFFVATLDLDTRIALSDLYPEPGFRATDAGSPNGGISGRVVIRTSGGDIPLTGINVVARRVSRGTYPPKPGTTAYPDISKIEVDKDGAPLPPPDRDETDPLATAASIVTGLSGPPGVFAFNGLPPGDYLLETQRINPNALGGSSIGPLGAQIPLPFQGFFNGPTDGQNATAFQRISVTPGKITTGIDIVLRGFSSAALSKFTEAEPNEKISKAQGITVPCDLTGSVNETDKAKVKVDFGSAGFDAIHDFYSFKVTKTGTYLIALDPISGSGDIDMFLFAGSLKGKSIPLRDPSILGGSFGPTSSEFIVSQLPAGDYLLGISASSGSAQYRIRIISTE